LVIGVRGSITLYYKVAISKNLSLFVGLCKKKLDKVFCCLVFLLTNRSVKEFRNIPANGPVIDMSDVEGHLSRRGKRR
jgi:hypothetical protein